MKFLTFSDGPGSSLGAPLDGGDVLNLTSLLRHELGDRTLETVRGLLEDRRRHTAHTVPTAQARLLAPIPRPRKNVFCVGRNYREHIIEGNRAAGRDPPTTSRRRSSCFPSPGRRSSARMRR